MSQTSINPAGQPIAVPGQLSDNGEGVDIVSRFSEETSANIAFGRGVRTGTARDGVLIPTGGSNIVEGVNLFGYNHLPGTTGDLDQTAITGGVKPKGGLKILRRGRCYVEVDAGLTTITKGQRAYLRFETDGASNTVVGRWRNTDDGHVIDTSTAAMFVSGIFTSADGTTKIAEIEVNFTAKP